MTRLALILALSTTPAAAHMAQSGWAYPTECCSGRDCFEFDGARIKETPDGYALPSGTVVPYNDRRLRSSPDDAYHLCVNFVNKRLMCLFVPPRAF